MTLIARDLTLGYQQQTIVSATSITLNIGEMTCLVGPNGCGKSTLLRALSGLLSPMTGEVTLDDKPLAAWSRKALARRLAFLPQNPVAPDDISVYQLVSHGRYAYQGLFGLTQPSDVEAVNWALEMTEMNGLRHRVFNTLSGGEKQRGWIALALAQQADLLLLDEPTTYLDIGHQLDILELLATLNQEHRITVVMVLHDINQASQYTDRLLVMRAGCIIADNTPQSVISASLVKQVFGIDIELITRQEGERAYPYSLPLRKGMGDGTPQCAIVL